MEEGGGEEGGEGGHFFLVRGRFGGVGWRGGDGRGIGRGGIEGGLRGVRVEENW